MNDDHMIVFVTSRKGNISYKTAFEKLPFEIEHFYQGKSLMIVFPDQYGDLMDSMSFAEPQHTEEKSAYNILIDWFRKKKKKTRDNEPPYRCLLTNIDAFPCVFISMREQDGTIWKTS